MMKRSPVFRNARASLRTAATLAGLAMLAGLAPLEPVAAAATVALWDSGTSSTERPDIGDRTGWKRVPSDLLALEADPPKASSDPGYYGREYIFKGDAVVENPHLTAAVWTAKGRLIIYPKRLPAVPGQTSPPAMAGGNIVDLVPLHTRAPSALTGRVTILRNTGDQVALEVAFDTDGAAAGSWFVAFDKTEIVEMKPAGISKGISLVSAVDYGVVPGFVGDDLIFSPADYPSMMSLCLPAENLFLGLLHGEGGELLLTWPKGKQQLRLELGKEEQGSRPIRSVDFEHDGQGFYLAVLSAPGLWHKETLTPSFLEKDVAIQWKKPFPAKWKTQLSEDGTRTTFGFRESKGQIWRGVPGSYHYPVWFHGDDALYHLSKKVPPQGDSLIYFLEGQDTPPSIATPVDLLKASLGRALSESILDVAGRKLRTHHRRGGDGVRRACTCGCTEAIQAVFEAGEEVAKKDSIQGEVDDMIYFVKCHVERIAEYRRFADDLLKLLQTKENSSAELKPFLDGLEPIVRQIPQQYELQAENMKSLGYADDLARQTLALASRKDPNNQKAYMELLKAWRAMGGAQDYVVAQCHTITRKLCQEAGYGAVHDPKAAALAQEIRSRCRQCLRNADGYEIWADY